MLFLNKLNFVITGKLLWYKLEYHTLQTVLLNGNNAA